MPSVGGRHRSRRIRRWPATAATALMAVGATIAVVLAGGAGTVPTARLAAVASAPGGDPAAGTAKAQAARSQQVTVRHAAMASSAAATGDLSTVLSETVHGGYVAAGTGMRNLGYGTISVAGIPAGAAVKSATLVWDILADSADPSFAQGTLNGQVFTGTQWASGASPCWPVSTNFSYEADVTGLVTGNGSYKLAGFATGQNDGADPWTSGSAAPLDEGASLVVVYQLSSMPEVTVQIGEGASETVSGDTATATLDGFTADAKPSAATTYIVADGQMPGNTASFNGTTLSGVSFPGDDPQAVPNYSQGNLWDTVTTDVSSYLIPGQTSATIGVTGNQDCLVWVGQVLSVSTGGTVLAFGDSVAAGEGIGLSTGYPDNSGAYSNVLATELGWSADDFAISGACAAGCSQSILGNELPAAESMHLKPNLITVTVGADDIQFGNCFLGTLGVTTSNPCDGQTFTDNLNTLKSNLGKVLSRISADYPGIPIAVTQYYNPLPLALPGNNSSVCSVIPTLLYISLLVRHQYTQAADLSTERVLGQQSKQYQQTVYNTAVRVLGSLNKVIGSAASNYKNVTVVPVDFTGHDFCQDYSGGSGGWVFGPSLRATFSYHIGLLSNFYQAQYSPSDLCNETIKGCYYAYTGTGSGDFWGLNYNYTYIFKTNDFPHPTPDGQKEIADLIKTKLNL
jgi:lysophospholipase L1-like esterase